MPENPAKPDDKTLSQHEKLRHRLQDELSNIKSTLESTDYDWFLRGSNLSNSSHLNSNTNSLTPIKSPSLASSNTTKAPPSVSTTEAVVGKNIPEPALIPLTRSKTADATLTRRRASDVPTNTGLVRTSTNVSSLSNSAPRRVSIDQANMDDEPGQKRRGSFFKKLFGSKKDDESPSSVPRATSPPRSRMGSLSSASPRTPSATRTPSSRRASLAPKMSSQDLPSPMSSPKLQSIDGFVLPTEEKVDEIFDKKANITLADQYKDVVDPKLYEYLKDLTRETTNQTTDSFDSSTNSVFAPSTESSIKYEIGVIPPHPDKPKLPSAFSLHPKYNKSVELEMYEKQKREKEKEKEHFKEGSMFGSILRRSKTQQQSEQNSLLRVLSNEANKSNTQADDASVLSVLSSPPVEHTPPPPKVIKAPAIQVLRELSPMKKVAFATTTFVYDPPQQIPSRHPRKGNVEVGEDGELIIHKVDPEEKQAATAGLVVGGTAHLKMLQHNDPSHRDDDNVSISSNNTTESSASGAPAMRKSDSAASMNSLDTTINKQDKLLAAQKAREHTGAEENDTSKDKLTIDKPMVKRNKSMDKPVVTLKLDELYTRCCHLREILPIPATLKQIPKGSTEPLPLLQLRNPRPSMIEVLSFSDYIRIAPIHCISLDGVTLTSEMFRIILSSLVSKKFLEKLSLRNTAIDAEGWKLLCFFLSMNKALKRLDLSQCPALVLNTQRLKKHVAQALDNSDRMQSNSQDRSDMDWSLFTATMIVRGGLEEIILSGCKINDLEVFKNLMYLGLPNIKKLGLAYNELSLNHCNIIVKWMTLNHDLVGIDIGYNDLGSYLKPFIEYTKQADNKNNVSLISLNTCSLLDNNDTQQFFDAVSKLPQLKYLDISNNKKLFPSFMSKLISYLPLFSKLTRLNLDNNALTPIAIIQLSETLPLIKNLNYLSLTGNKLTEACYVSLCHSLKNSRSIFTFDFDKDDVPQKYQEKIGLLTMKNMERALYGKHDNASTSILSDTTKQAKSDSFEGKSFSDIMIDINNSTANKEVVANFIKHADSMRKELHSTISELVELQVKGTLTFEGKETLIRLITIDSSILKGLELINSSVAKMYEPSDATKLLNNIVETDQNKDRDSDTNSDSTSATLNENENDNEAVELKDDSIPSVKLARSSSAASLMAEEEAKTFKDVNLIKKASSQSLNTSVEDCVLKSGKNGSDTKKSNEWPKSKRWSKESLIDKLSSSSDAIDLVQIINNLKSAGLTLTDLYTKRDDDGKKDLARESSGSETFANNKVTESNTMMNTRGDSRGANLVSSGSVSAIATTDDVTLDDNYAGDLDSLESYNDDETSDPHIDADVSDAYDSVLAEIVKTRTANEKAKGK